MGIGRRLSAESTVLEQDALFGAAQRQLFDLGAADRIKYQASAFPSGDALNLGDQVGLVGGDDVLGALLPQRRSLRARAGRGNRHRARPVG